MNIDPVPLDFGINTPLRQRKTVSRHNTPRDLLYDFDKVAEAVSKSSLGKRKLKEIFKPSIPEPEHLSPPKVHARIKKKMDNTFVLSSFYNQGKSVLFYEDGHIKTLVERYLEQIDEHIPYYINVHCTGAGIIAYVKVQNEDEDVDKKYKNGLITTLHIPYNVKTVIKYENAKFS